MEQPSACWSNQWTLPVADPVRFLIIDREVNLAIHRACGNPALADFGGDLHAHTMKHRRRAMAEPDAVSRSHADHEAIVEALARHDPDATMRALERHYRAHPPNDPKPSRPRPSRHKPS